MYAGIEAICWAWRWQAGPKQIQISKIQMTEIRRRRTKQTESGLKYLKLIVLNIWKFVFAARALRTVRICFVFRISRLAQASLRVGFFGPVRLAFPLFLSMSSWS